MPGRIECEPRSAFGGSITFFASQAFIDLLEEIEPGVHAYASFELRYGTENDYTTHQYYAVRPVEFDGVDAQASDVEWREGTHGASRYWKKKDGVPLVFDPDLIKEKHFWRKSRPDYRFISPELHDAMQARGLTTSWLFEKQIVAGKQTISKAGASCVPAH